MAPHGEATAALTAALAPLVASARAAWPDVQLDAATFVEHVRERLPGPEAPVPSGALHAADLYLACACAHGEPRALAHFDAEYIARIQVVLARMNLPPDAVDELKQLVRDRLLVAGERAQPRISDYSGQGTLRSWLAAVATRTALNWLAAAKRGQSIDAEDVPELAASDDDPELTALRTRYAADFKVAFAEAFSVLAARQRLLLRQHFVDGLSTEEIGKVYRVHRVTALRWLNQARDDLGVRLQAALAARLGVNNDEYRSLVKLVRSQLDLSLSRLAR
jgi:RNA polymerase sigma-70 factor (ECF subfamily)